MVVKLWDSTLALSVQDLGMQEGKFADITDGQHSPRLVVDRVSICKLHAARESTPQAGYLRCVCSDGKTSGKTFGPKNTKNEKVESQSFFDLLTCPFRIFTIFRD